MKRESAVSETISYDTGHCSICEREVALGQSVPDDVIDPKAYAVILGEGELSKNVEHEGNWEFELVFQLDETDQRHPNVNGFIICEECARNIHGHPDDADHYHGKIPSEIVGGSLSDETAVEMNQAAVALAILLLVIILILVFSL
ncbi:hypothetical protein [Halapricum salinum]|uniref:Uncharacterized protein n=1 Tax=Halapricum salinum TaxID=1457250 RepID=A0A4D6HED2_9EURY|nr:hypothetical protein [Halapricum salinum]QCC51402.1 hypothetical protein DV733_09180 [Halapricum salinum]